MSKLKHSFILVLFTIAFGPAVQAQPGQPRPDSSIQEIAKENLLDNIPIVSVDENDNQDGSAQNVSSVLTAGRDPFYNGAVFHFSAVRFRFRGLDADGFSTYMNGVPMENLDNGFTPFGLWSGLNDVLRNRDASLGLRPTGYAYGDFGGIMSIDTRASKQRKQTIFGYSAANRTYENLVKFSHSTGLGKTGWAFTIAGSGRWADEGFVEGTYFRGGSAFIGIDKRVNSKHLLSLVAMASPTENGRNTWAVEEMRLISGNEFYNPSWGYQDGKKRNSNVAKVTQPIIILTHDWKLNDKMSLMTAGSYIFGKRSVSGIDWYNAADPRPDYYRYLPSYQTDPAVRTETYLSMMDDVNRRQINWSALYNTNYISMETIRNANGVQGNNVTGRRSHYILEDRVTYTNRLNFNTVFTAAVSNHFDLNAGGSYQYQKNKYYKEVNDLLGGAFYVDINQFAERDFRGNAGAVQNDLNNPNRILRVGDKFGYNYDIDIKKATAWMQGIFKFRKIDFFLAAEQSYTTFARIGNTRVGLFPQNSFGRSKNQNFYNYAFKGGITLKIDGRNYFFANGSYLTRAPFFDNAYIAPRTRDFVQDNLSSERLHVAEAGYVMNGPNVKLRATGYFTNIANSVNVLTFYDEQYSNFVNYALSNIGRMHFGMELGADVKVYKGLSLNAAANFGRYYYTTRQKATVTIDNSSEVVAKDVTIYSENFRVATPQQAYTVGFYYRDPKFWTLSMNVNRFDQMWLDFNPLRRTVAAVEGVNKNSFLYKSIIDQTQLSYQYTVDMFASWSWKINNAFPGIKKSTYFNLSVGINNLLDNQKLITGGSEQLRFDFEERNINKFPPRYFSGFGRTFIVSAGIRF